MAESLPLRRSERIKELRAGKTATSSYFEQPVLKKEKEIELFEHEEVMESIMTDNYIAII